MGPTGPSQTGIPLNATASNACSDVGWALRPARSAQAEELHIYLISVHLPLGPSPDIHVWCIDSEEFDQFSTKKTWEALRQRSSLQPWTEHVWFKGHIPRHAFIMWLMHLDRLPTRDRLARWGMQLDLCGCLCGSHLESRDHIFLHYEISEVLWSKVTHRLGYSAFSFHIWLAFSVWHDTKDSISPLSLRRLAAQATLYSLWQERNNRYHNNISTDAIVLFKKLERQIRDALLAKQHRKQFAHLLQTWLDYD
ncbi:PREDICTED: uncharacterized protein LOC104753302 [Camelina sativa]|uniref:Uncharacterized protein LOC104753302 n=1 Tax=Camelina sativa TaxID=90675 RepID=A0ABM0WNY3_CAMSA|nr:PREDICTED: uncharacterized protein LOC104753302 [Camelina sativa]